MEEKAIEGERKGRQYCKIGEDMCELKKCPYCDSENIIGCGGERVKRNGSHTKRKICNDCARTFTVETEGPWWRVEEGKKEKEAYFTNHPGMRENLEEVCFTRMEEKRKEKKRELKREYYKNHKEEAFERRDRRKRLLGFSPINIPFEGSEGHHMTTEIVVYIPAGLHRSVFHNVFTGVGMDEINGKVLVWAGLSSS